jgi:hypothetical protein
VLGPGRTMAFVTITYGSGIALQAIVLSHEEHEIRAAAAGCDDVMVFTRSHGTWISEDGEPVTIEFAWQRRGASHVPSEDECICTKELAARLIPTVFGDDDRDEAESDTIHVLSPDGTHVAIHLAGLKPN